MTYHNIENNHNVCIRKYFFLIKRFSFKNISIDKDMVKNNFNVMIHRIFYIPL